MNTQSTKKDKKKIILLILSILTLLTTFSEFIVGCMKFDDFINKKQYLFSADFDIPPELNDSDDIPENAYYKTKILKRCVIRLFNLKLYLKDSSSPEIYQCNLFDDLEYFQNTIDIYDEDDKFYSCDEQYIKENFWNDILSKYNENNSDKEICIYMPSGNNDCEASVTHIFDEGLFDGYIHEMVSFLMKYFNRVSSYEQKHERFIQFLIFLLASIFDVIQEIRDFCFERITREKYTPGLIDRLFIMLKVFILYINYHVNEIFDHLLVNNSQCITLSNMDKYDDMNQQLEQWDKYVFEGWANVLYAFFLSEIISQLLTFFCSIECARDFSPCTPIFTFVILIKYVLLAIVTVMSLILFFLQAEMLFQSFQYFNFDMEWKILTYTCLFTIEIFFRSLRITIQCKRSHH